jgi:formylglycine-generating enzyme required for sulfatase activity
MNFKRILSAAIAAIIPFFALAVSTPTINATRSGESVRVQWGGVNASELDHYVLYSNIGCLYSGTGTSYNDSQADSTSTWTYWVEAWGKDGTTAQSATVTVSSDGSSSGGGSFEIEASDGTSTEGVEITWSAVGGAAGYRVVRGNNSNMDYASILVETVTGTSYTDTTATAGKTYYYWIVAKKSSGSIAGVSSPDTGYRASGSDVGGGGSESGEPMSTIYCVIDLSMGDNASSYPVIYLTEPPQGGFNIDEYKTTKLVLRRIEPGSFMMGGETSSGYGSAQVNVTLTKPFFIGLFEVTQKQYQLVMGGYCSNSEFSGDKRPVDGVFYNDIRGAANGAAWPQSSAVDSISFLGKLRERTGLEFDLPTEAQWEYACRAGTSTLFSYGYSANGDYMWYESNSDSKTHDVGTRQPNAWGLYDMHGNVWEWCLDWYEQMGKHDGGTDPTGPSEGQYGAYRIVRGGAWHNKENYCTSSGSRFEVSPSTGRSRSASLYWCYGFRLATKVSYGYTVKFNANGGSGTMSDESFTCGTEKALAANAFTRTGYTFTGWATSATGLKV